MKTQRIAMIALAVAGTLSGAAFADPEGVTLYGVLDAGIGSIQHQGNTLDGFASTVNPFTPVKGTAITTGTPVTGVLNGVIQDSRWGLRGTEDLGDGVKTIFAVESGINLPTGQLNNNDATVAAGGTSNVANSSLSGQLFNRQAWVGLKDDSLGTLTIGRQYMPIYDILTRYDNVRFSQLLSPLSFSGGFGGGIGISEDMREDNSVKYSNTIGGFNFGGLYRFGGISGHTGARSDYALNLGYEDGGFGIQAAYERLYDAVKAAKAASATATATVATGGTISGTTIANLKLTPATAIIADAGVAANIFNSVGYLIAAKYTFDIPLTLRGGYSHYELTNGDLSAAQMGVSQIYGTTITNPTTSNQTLAAGAVAATRLFWLGGDYKLTDRDQVGVGLYHIEQAAAAAYGATKSDGGQNQYNANVYSVLFDHNLSKRTDVYAGLTFTEYSNFGDTYNAAGTYTTNRALAAGLRTKF